MHVMHRNARSSAARSCDLSNPSLFTTLLAMGMALQKHNYQPYTHPTPQMWHQAHLTPSTSWPNPTYGSQWPPSPVLSSLTDEEGTGDGCVLQQLIHPGQGADVGDGGAHLRIHEFNKLLNMVVALLGPNMKHPTHSPARGGGAPAWAYL
jgi:hypothetical protein